MQLKQNNMQTNDKQLIYINPLKKKEQEKKKKKKKNIKKPKPKTPV